jgi:hypothetical protein
MKARILAAVHALPARLVQPAVATVAALALGAAGCDTLFAPPKPLPDLAMPRGDGGAPVELTGVVCELPEVTSPRKCQPLPVGARLTVTLEETRQQAVVNGDGSFALPLPPLPAKVTLVVTDGTGLTYQTSVVPVELTQATVDSGSALVPVVAKQTLAALAAQAVFQLDAISGALLAFVVDATGAPRSGVVPMLGAAQVATGPFCDTGDPGLLVTTGATGPLGTFAFFQLRPGDVMLSLLRPGVGATQFTLPVRAGGLTIQALVLP